ncbi:GNAT family N-acetyltransferase [Yoonia maritima]|uniref:GNAT family N-acetyltransferase n=1 Tax=Yoonia maritima TaxID=1435347 RepID=UPI003735E95A
MTVPTLRTQRLVLGELCRADLDNVVRYAGDYDVSKWLVPVCHPYTQSDADAFLEMDRLGQLGSLWVIKQNDAFLGVVSIGKELGYWLGQPAWGQGIMTEAAGAALSSHFLNRGVGKVCSSYFVGNRASARVLEKLGFVEVGEKVQFSKARNANVAARLVELTRARWDQSDA